MTTFILAARDRYLQAMQLIGVETSLGRLVQLHSEVEIRIFGEVYEVMAPYFRQSLPVQMPLPFSWDKFSHPVGKRWQKRLASSCNITRLS